MSLPAGLKLCKACGRAKPLECFAIVTCKGRRPYRRGTCIPCHKRWDAARPRRAARTPKVPSSPEYYARYRQTEIGRLVRQRADARRKLKHWVAKLDTLTREIEKYRAI